MAAVLTKVRKARSLEDCRGSPGHWRLVSILCKLAHARRGCMASAMAARGVECETMWRTNLLELAINGGEHDLRRAAEQAAKEADEARRAARTAAQRGWGEWVKDSLAGSAKQAHRWANAFSALPPIQPWVKEGSSLITQPLQAVEHHAAAWARKWKAHDEDNVDAAMSLVRRTRLRALDNMQAEELPEIKPDAVRRASKCFPSESATAFDGWAFGLVASLPDEALEDLGRMMQDSIENLTLPLQSLIQIIALLGKKKGGSRPIAILASYYGIIMKLLKCDVSDWDIRVGGRWDSALKGSSALRAGVMRALKLEVAVSQGKHCLQFLWDIEAFYDNINLEVMVPKLIEKGYPMVPLVLVLIAHKAPRCFRLADTYSTILQGSGLGILPGCLQSNSWARGLLHNMLEDMANAIPEAPCGQHVDDLSQLVTENSARELYTKGMAVARRVGKGLKNLELPLSSKSVLLPKGAKEAKQVAKALAKEGIHIKLEIEADDLGLGTTALRRRTAKKAWARITAAGKRAARVAALDRRTRCARQLFRTGVQPQQTWGCQAQGASPSQV